MIQFIIGIIGVVIIILSARAIFQWSIILTALKEEPNTYIAPFISAGMGLLIIVLSIINEKFFSIASFSFITLSILLFPNEDVPLATDENSGNIYKISYWAFGVQGRIGTEHPIPGI